jgi:hypothetical protein
VKLKIADEVERNLKCFCLELSMPFDTITILNEPKKCQRFQIYDGPKYKVSKGVPNTLNA